MKTKELGRIGEDIACKFLMKRGFRVVDRNYLRKCGEIDVVAKREGSTHFVEVKTVSCENFNFLSSKTGMPDSYRPEDNIHQYKINRLRRVIQLYLIEKYIKDDWQFHAITVRFNVKRREAKVEFLENLIL